MKYATPVAGRQIRIRNQKSSLLLATFLSSETIVNSSLEFNLVNELRRFFASVDNTEEICLELSEGEKILKSEYPEPEGLGVSDAADLISARSRVQCSLDILLSAGIPRWLGQDKLSEAKLSLVQLVNEYDRQIELKLKRPIDAERHEQNGNVCP